MISYHHGFYSHNCYLYRRCGKFHIGSLLFFQQMLIFSMAELKEHDLMHDLLKGISPLSCSNNLPVPIPASLELSFWFSSVKWVE